MPKTQPKTLAIRLELKQLKELQKIANKEFRSVASLVRQAVGEFLERRVK